MSALRHAVLALALLYSALGAAQAIERIPLFISDVRVLPDGDLLVTETIRVEAEGHVIRRGILRDFPTRYMRPDGTRVEVAFAVESVTRDGASESYALEPMANGVRVRIGRPDVSIATGLHDYAIRYRTTRQIGFFANYDELYWNATGTGWTLPIDVAEARITLPQQVPWLQTAIYTGPQGARGNDAVIVAEEPGHIVFRTTRPLPPENGLTVAAAWAKGVVAEPGRARLLGWWLADNPAAAGAIAGSLLVVGYYLYAYLHVGRDPRRGTIVPLFAPPNGMSAAAVRYVRRMGLDDRAYAAAMIDLGVRRHLRLVDVGKHTEVQRRAGGQEIPAAEASMEDKLFAGRATSVLLTQANQKTLAAARAALMRGLLTAYSDKLFHNHRGWAGLGLLGSIVVLALVILTLAATHPGSQRPSLIEIVSASLSVLGVVIAISSFRFLRVHTREGRAVVDQIEGFRLYLGVAEEDRLEALNPPEKTPELFERFLPYAVALDVENTWGRRFAGVLAAAAASAAAAQTVGDSWYSGSHDIASDPGGFANHLGTHLTDTIAAASTAPGSSGGGFFAGSSGGGSSGGGESGGGGGGGGSGGW